MSGAGARTRALTHSAQQQTLRHEGGEETRDVPVTAAQAPTELRAGTRKMRRNLRKGLYAVPEIKISAAITELDLSDRDAVEDDVFRSPPRNTRSNERTCWHSWAASGADMGDIGIASIAACVGRSPALTSLKLQGNGITPKGMLHLAAALEKRTGLVVLDLSDNAFGDSGARHLVAALARHTTLAQLRLARTGMSAAGVGELAVALGRNKIIAASGDRERYLRLEGNEAIGVRGARHLAAALETNTTLESLVLVDACITSKGAISLARALSINTSLVKLHLGGNQIGVGGARQLATALGGNCAMQSIVLYANNLGDDGAWHLACALQDNKNLTQLAVGGNGIGNKGAGFLAQALTINSTLFFLDLCRNDISDKGATKLATMLPSNRALLELCLNSNRISSLGTLEFGQVLSTHPRAPHCPSCDRFLVLRGLRLRHVASDLQTIPVGLVGDFRNRVLLRFFWQRHERRLAFLMLTQHRLGNHSRWSQLDAEVVSLIARDHRLHYSGDDWIELLGGRGFADQDGESWGSEVDDESFFESEWDELSGDEDSDQDEDIMDVISDSVSIELDSEEDLPDLPDLLDEILNTNQGPEASALGI
jgi:Ran GTPase-activating protein (RanGAP) involved in mRNA processing and transport